MKRTILPILALLIMSMSFVPDQTTLFDLIGLPVKSKVAKAFIKESGTCDEYKSSECYYYMFNSKGYDLMMSNGDTIMTVFVFAEGADNHKQYSGELPFGLQMKMTREEVEKLLGVPETTGGSGVIPYYSSWDATGVGITYESLDTLDLTTKIHHISFSERVGK